jgi:hypothetical protein
MAGLSARNALFQGGKAGIADSYIIIADCDRVWV